MEALQNLANIVRGFVAPKVEVKNVQRATSPVARQPRIVQIGDTALVGTKGYITPRSLSPGREVLVRSASPHRSLSPGREVLVRSASPHRSVSPVRLISQSAPQVRLVPREASPHRSASPGRLIHSRSASPVQEVPSSRGLTLSPRRSVSPVRLLPQAVPASRGLTLSPPGSPRRSASPVRLLPQEFPASRGLTAPLSPRRSLSPSREATSQSAPAMSLASSSSPRKTIRLIDMSDDKTSNTITLTPRTPLPASASERLATLSTPRSATLPIRLSASPRSATLSETVRRSASPLRTVALPPAPLITSSPSRQSASPVYPYTPRQSASYVSPTTPRQSASPVSPRTPPQLSRGNTVAPGAPYLTRSRPLYEVMNDAVTDMGQVAENVLPSNMSTSTLSSSPRFTSRLNE